MENLNKNTTILYDRLKKNSKVWSESNTIAVRNIKAKVNNLPCLTLANPNCAKIIDTDALDIGYGGILKQYSPKEKQVYIVQFYSGK